MFEFREIKNETEYNPLLISKNTPFTQAWFFGEWQEIMGRKIRRFEILKNSETIGFFQMIKYSLPFGQSFLYIPHGPIFRLVRQSFSDGGSFSEGGVPLSDFLKEFKEKLFEIGKDENAIFARFDFYFHNSLPAGDLSKGDNYGSRGDLDIFFKKTPAYAYHSSYFQPKFEWILDLKKSEDEIFEGIHPKTRYNIRLAEKRGVKTEIVNENFNRYFNDFYRLLKKTAGRDNFNLHPKIYYENIFNTINTKNTFLAIAGYENKILLVNLILMFGKTAYFLFGGSSGEYKNLMFSHLAQWETIKEAKKQGFEIYNFGAVDGKFSAQGGPASGWEGISFFKKRFGGEILEYSDSYDLILKPFWYFLYNLNKLLKQLI